MITTMSDLIVADVRTSETMDCLVVTPRVSSEGHNLSRVLAQALPGVPISRSALGFKIPAFRSHQLLEVAADLRWDVEAKRFVENRQRVQAVHPTLFQKLVEIREGGKAVAEAELRDVKGLKRLDDHQWVNVAAMTMPGGVGLSVFDEQGAGKTVTFIYAFDVLVNRDEADFALIVAPKSMVPEWPRDFQRFKSDLYKVVIASGPAKLKRAALASGADVVVTNFETAISMEDEIRSLLRRRPGRGVLAVDESFYAKNLEAQRTRSLRRLREWCGRAYVLCGTPAPNSPQDLVQQFNIVDFGMTFEGVSVPEERESARPVVQQAIEERGLYLRHLKVDVLPDLPVKQFHRVMVELQPDQQRLYKGALNDLIIDLKATDDTTFQREIASFLARRTALLQICSNPAAVAKGYTEVPAKLKALDDLLNETIGVRGEKVVLWSFFTGTIDAMMSRYGRFNAVRYDGTVADVAERREAVRRFQEDDTTMLFVANPAAAGAGLTLHRARLAIYESMSNQAAHYLQSLDRIHRRGQTRDVEYLVLLCEKTIEIEEYERLTEKEKAAQSLLGDHVALHVTRTAMLRSAVDAANLLELK